MTADEALQALPSVAVCLRRSTAKNKPTATGNAFTLFFFFRRERKKKKNTRARETLPRGLEDLCTWT
jgi:hypothetical protein